MNTKLKCLLLDDELPGLTYLKMLCEQIPQLEVVKAFNRSEQLLAEAASLTFDLCILDIEMVGKSGMEVAEMLQDKLIIFSTAHKEYAAEAFDLGVVDFVCKPIELERLQKAVNKAVKQLNNKPSRKFINLNTDKGKSILYLDQLSFIKTSLIDSRDKDVLLRDGTRICLKNISFEKLEGMLPHNLFCRINKQEIIAIDIVQHFSSDQITSTIFSDETEKPLVLFLSEVYRKTFLEKVKI